MTDTLKHQWNLCLKMFQDNMSAEHFASFIEPVTPVSLEEGKLVLRVPSQFFIEQLEERYASILRKTLHKYFGPDIKLYYHTQQVANDQSTGVTFASSQSSPAVAPKAPQAAGNRQAVPQVVDSQLNPNYTFENYCGSTSNQVARSIGEAIANDPKCKTFNPLFVFGRPGVGKTHLIQAIGIRIKENNPMANVLYVTSRLFESQFTSAANNGKINEFLNFYQSIDTLIIDDIQDLIGKKGTQNAFFHIFNHLILNNRQIILASDTCPLEMKGMEERLVSRFKMGMVAELDAPDFDLRRQVLLQKTERDGLQLPAEVIDYIAENVTESIREIEGIIVTVTTHAAILNREIDLELTRKVMARTVKIQQRQINFEIIAQAVASYYNIEPDQIFTKSRKREISDARQMIMYMAKKHAHMALEAIGTRLSRTHATVIYACRSIEERLGLEKQLQADVRNIEASLR